MEGDGFTWSIQILGYFELRMEGMELKGDRETES
jgi:hypothetical protein